MNRSFLQIMREAYNGRMAGMSVFVALASTMDDDADWEVLWQRLMEAARLDKALKRYRPRRDRQ
jgi:hypothetical protein